MKSILVIDDDDIVRTMLTAMLERENYRVITAINGAEALEKYHAEPTDLVITDIIMPEKEGIETILELKRSKPDIKIIAVSGGGRVGPQDYLNVAKKFGAQYTFTKPFDRKSLIDAVKDLIG